MTKFRKREDARKSFFPYVLRLWFAFPDYRLRSTATDGLCNDFTRSSRRIPRSWRPRTMGVILLPANTVWVNPKQDQDG